MDLEDEIAKLIKEEYASDGYEDAGHSDVVAHAICKLLVRSYWPRTLSLTATNLNGTTAIAQFAQIEEWVLKEDAGMTGGMFAIRFKPLTPQDMTFIFEDGSATRWMAPHPRPTVCQQLIAFIRTVITAIRK